MLRRPVGSQRRRRTGVGGASITIRGRDAGEKSRRRNAFGNPTGKDVEWLLNLGVEERAVSMGCWQANDT